jgi:hypothetical protein
LNGNIQKIDDHYDLALFPMAFEEFVITSGNAPLARAFERTERNDTIPGF